MTESTTINAEIPEVFPWWRVWVFLGGCTFSAVWMAWATVTRGARNGDFHLAIVVVGIFLLAVTLPGWKRLWGLLFFPLLFAIATCSSSAAYQVRSLYDPALEQASSSMIAAGKRGAQRKLALRAEYESRLAALGLGQAMEPISLVTGDGLASAERKILQAIALVEEVRSKDAASSHLLIDEMSRGEPPETQEMLRKRAALMSLQAAEYARHEDTLYQEMLAMVRDLRGARARWTVRDGKFVFSEDRDLTAYQAHSAAIDDAIARLDGGGQAEAQLKQVEALAR